MRGLILVVDYTTGISCPATSVITKYYRFFLLLQSATGITKWDDHYKVRQNRPTLCIDFISWRENLVADIFHETAYEH